MRVIRHHIPGLAREHTSRSVSDVSSEGSGTVASAALIADAGEPADVTGLAGAPCDSGKQSSGTE